MKNKQTITSIIVLLSVFMLFPEDKTEIDQVILNQIKKTLNNPVKTYKLDKNRTLEHLNIIDQWFIQETGLEKVNPVKKKNQNRWVYKRLVKKNSPILFNKKQNRGLKTEKPFTIRYEKEGLERSFRKDIRIPTKKQLQKSRVIEIGKTWVLSNKFIKESSLDKMALPLVATWRSHPLKENITEKEKYTILQRVIFRRHFDGCEVINSKIIVDVHPDSEEILSYKHFDWSSIKEESGKIYHYISLDTVMKKIGSAMKEHKGTYQIHKVQQKMFQSPGYLIPVLVVEISVKSEDLNRDESPTTLIINLLEDISFDTEMEKMVRPKTVKEKMHQR